MTLTHPTHQINSPNRKAFGNPKLINRAAYWRALKTMTHPHKPAVTQAGLAAVVQAAGHECFFILPMTHLAHCRTIRGSRNV